MGAGSAYAQSWEELVYEWKEYHESYVIETESYIRELENAIEDLEIQLAHQESFTNPVLRGIIYGEINYYVDPLPFYSTYDISHFDEFLDGRYEQGIKLTRVYDESQADFTIMWVKDYGPEYLGVAYSGNIATVSLGATSCDGTWQHLTDWSITQTTWHEIGHVLGYGHSDKVDNIMYPSGETQFKKDRDFNGTLPPNWYEQIDFCNDGEQYYYVDVPDHNASFQIFILPYETDNEEFFNEGKGSYYPGCEEINDDTWYSKGNSCNVGALSKVLIYNPGDKVMHYEGYMEDRRVLSEIDMDWDDDFYQYDTEYLDYIHALFS